MMVKTQCGQSVGTVRQSMDNEVLNMTIDIQKNIKEIEETINKNKIIDAQMEQLDHEHDINIERISNLQNDIEKELKDIYEDVVWVDINKKKIRIRMRDIVEFDYIKAIHDTFDTKHKNIVLESNIKNGELYIDMIINI